MFDIKLKNGKYFSNIFVIDEITGDMNSIEKILHNDNKMFIYHANNINEEELMVIICSDDIEYICKSYKYKDGE